MRHGDVIAGAGFTQLRTQAAASKIGRVMAGPTL